MVLICNSNFKAMFDASAGWIIVTMVGLMAGCAAALIGVFSGVELLFFCNFNASKNIDSFAQNTSLSRHVGSKNVTLICI